MRTRQSLLQMDSIFTIIYGIDALIRQTASDFPTINSLFSFITNHSYGYDSTSDTTSKILNISCLSNAPIESFFKILKHSILQHKTNLRPGEVLLKLYLTTVAHLKADEYGITQTRSRQHELPQANHIDETALTEKWKIKGTRTAIRGVFFQVLNEAALTSAEIRTSLNENRE